MHSSIITKYRRHRGTPTVSTNIHKPRVRIESVAKFSKVNTNMATIDNAGHDKYCCTHFLTAMEDCIRNYLSTRFLIDLTLEKLRCKPLEETQGQILAHVFHPLFCKHRYASYMYSRCIRW